MKIEFLENEYWYGGNVTDGLKVPLAHSSRMIIDLTTNKTPNQSMPFFLSSKGRYIWRDTGFKIEFDQGTIIAPDDIVLIEGCGDLKGAYLDAMKKHFPFSEKMPAKELFENPVYNTWIELTFFQNQEAIERYATDILNSDLPAGALMIDDGWSNYYGDWRFNSSNFPKPIEMIEHLKDLGYQLMLWICPFVTPDTVKYRELRDKDMLVKNPDGSSFITQWWNGHSAVLDMTNPETVDWLSEQLAALQKLGIDGFKFDAGDSQYYREDNQTFANASPNDQSIAWANFGEKYQFNEYRVTFNAGGRPLFQRLCDKNHAWGDNGIASLIPDTLAQGITGHPYSCPDMIGGGEYLNFANVESNLDSELFVRHAEIACLMPSMQFSAAPYRILDEMNFNAVKKSIGVRQTFMKEILQLVEEVSSTGEPIVRYMAYEFPNSGAEKVTNQFMLGSNILVAPIFEKNKCSRKVFIPVGIWTLEDCSQIIGEDSFVEMQSEFGKPIILRLL